ncbi:MAG: trypsin-like peptidase domain-containing protein, partial [Ilumatobacteraceae bacterium]
TADTAGNAGRTASPWPSGPAWAPPTNQLPPIASNESNGSRLPLDSRGPLVSAKHGPDRSRRSALVAVLVVAAVIASGGAGYAGATLANDNSTPATSATAAPLSYAGGELDVTSLVKAVEPSVVTIQTKIEVSDGFRRGTGEAAGTGIVLTADGEILTNAHVVADATKIQVTITDANGTATAYRADLVGADTANDVALLNLVGASGLIPAKLGDSDAVVVGEDAVAIGNALALEGGVSVTKGIISALDRSIDVEKGTLNHLIQTDAAISSGNSGGPLLNANGEVIGMNSAGAASSANVTAENIGFAIPINGAMKIVAQLRNAA